MTHTQPARVTSGQSIAGGIHRIPTTLFKSISSVLPEIRLADSTSIGPGSVSAPGPYTQCTKSTFVLYRFTTCASSYRHEKFYKR